MGNTLNFDSNIQKDALVEAWEETDVVIDASEPADGAQTNNVAHGTSQHKETSVKTDSVNTDEDKSVEPRKEGDRISDLEEKLGIKLDDLANQQKDSEEETTEKVELSSEQEVWFEKAFEKKFGVKVDEALQVVNQLQQFQDYLQQAGGTDALVAFRIQQQETQLASDWGVDKSEVDRRLTAVRSYFDTLPADKKAALDNPEGAQLIWAYLEKDLGTGTAVPAGIQRSSRPTTPGARVTQPPKKYKLSDLIDLSDEEYSRINWDDVSADALEVDTRHVKAF